MDVIYAIFWLAGSMLSGTLVGLIPFFLGRYMGKPGLGKLGLLCSILGSIFFLQLPVAIGFVLAVIIKKHDFIWPQRSAAPQQQTYQGQPVREQPAAPGGSLNLTCLSGPLRGQIYSLGSNGLTMGRDPSCGVRFPEGTPGISGRHCCIRWQQGVPILEDLNSRYGTFMGDGRKLPPNYPIQLAAGSRFYLANTGCMFQMTLQ